jgi:hypothetical protein
MYRFLFDQTYISMAVYALLIFLIMFLWRKITILEGSFFILEKRVNVIKKTDRLDTINKNIEGADTLMNEIFKDSVNKNYCNNVSSSSKSEINKKLQNNIKIEEQYFNKSDVNYNNILNIDENLIKKKDVSENEQMSTYLDEIIPENYDNFEISEVKFNIDNDNDIDLSHNQDIKNNNIENIVVNNDNSYPDNTDNVSICSDITFGNDIDNNLKKKYKNMNVEKLREECKEKSLNTEGTKATLISRILEHNKKLK